NSGKGKTHPSGGPMYFRQSILAVTGSLVLAAAGAGQTNVADPAAQVSQRVQLWQPASEERRFDDIGWAGDLLEARRLAKENNRPIFLFTHKGHMALGRC